MSFCLKYQKDGKPKEEKFGSYYLSVVRANQLKKAGIEYTRYENTLSMNRSDYSNSKLGVIYSSREQKMLENLLPNFKYGRIKNKKGVK